MIRRVLGIIALIVPIVGCFGRFADGGSSVTHAWTAESGVSADPDVDSGTICKEVDGPCLRMMLGGMVALAMRRPASKGAHQLHELGAAACLYRTTACVPVEGSLEVEESVGRCEGGACGRFQALLALEPPPAGSPVPRV